MFAIPKPGFVHARSAIKAASVSSGAAAARYAGAEHIYVKDAGSHPDFHSRDVVMFHDGLVLADLLGSYRDDSGRDFCVVPVVPPAWEMSEEVPLWAGCVAQGAEGCHGAEFKESECRRLWNNIHASSGRPYVAGDHETFHKAVGEVESVYGVRSAAHAPIVQWIHVPTANGGDDTGVDAGEAADNSADALFQTSVRVAAGMLLWCVCAGLVLVMI